MLLLFALSLSYATPLQYNHQGRLLDTDGNGLSGEHELMFRIYDTEDVVLWEETLQVDFENGFYSLNLGEDESNNPLDDSIFAAYPLWMELSVDGDALEPRHPIQSVPYANIAGTAESVDGGVVNASEVRIDDFTVIDTAGSWMGNPINWNDLEGVPADIFDGDDDTQLQESEVEDYISNGIIDLFAESTVGGQSIVTIAPSSCFDGEILVWDGTQGAWFCEADSLDALSLNCAADEILKWDSNALDWSCQSDNDTQLSPSDVLAIVESSDIQSVAAICDQNGCIGDSLWTSSGADVYFNGGNVWWTTSACCDGASDCSTSEGVSF